MNIFLKNIFLLLFILLSGFVDCQTKEIDSLLQKAEESYLKFQDIQEFKYARKANILAIKANDSKRISESYIHIAQALANLELNKESLICINKIKSQESVKNNALFQARIKQIKAIIYSNQGFINQSLQELINASKILENEKDSVSLTRLAGLYGDIGNRYSALSNYNEALKYYKKAKQIINFYPEKKQKDILSFYYRGLGTIHLEKKNYDSAYYYYKKSYENNLQNKKLIFLDFSLLGNYYYFKKNYRLAIDNYEKALFLIKQDKINSTYASATIYSSISINYDSIGDKTNKDRYEKIFLQKQKELNNQQKKNIDYVLANILKDKEDETRAAQRKNYIWISSIFLVLSLSLLFVYKIFKKKLKQKETLITEKESSLLEKDEIISQKEVETKDLQLKVSDAVTHLIELGKNNDLTFYFKFQEVYPEFHKVLLENFPGLRNTELVLSAYTFLGFSTKDVAEYTFKSVNTIRNRKQNLRKKFGVPTDQDMGIWLKKLIYPDEKI